ncbi:phosphatidylinositol phosphatase PTPRQ-like isoform X2 [Clavelina lepadiformis]|uniref:phosphatidylinositol phosphatase PTPRQ-like isoform X2 n=1 Tax=Clavelina lepadiformis TaxID=159417 RepID=UPI0040421C51
MKRIKTLKMILVFFLAVLIYGQTAYTLEVHVDEITASSITISWSGSDFVEHSLTLDDKAEFTNTSDTTIRLSGLNSSEAYNLTLRSRSQTWSTNIVTGECPGPLWLGSENACYETSEKSVLWAQARDECVKIGSSHLADPHSRSEINFIEEVFTKSEIYWIGISDFDNDGQYSYSDASKIEWDIWSSWPKRNEKNSSPTSGECINFWPSSFTNTNHSEWGDVDCKVNFPYICQYDVPRTPKKLDVTTSSNTANFSWGDLSSDVELDVTSPEDDNLVISSSVINPHQSSFDLENLSSGRLYFARAHAFHVITDGVSAKKVYGASYPVTYFVTNPLPPENVTVQEVSPTSVELHWDEPNLQQQLKHNNTYTGFLLTYELENRPDDTPGNFTNMGEILLNETARSVLVENLEPTSKFIFRLYSVSSHHTSVGEKRALSNLFLTTSVLTDVSPPLSLEVKPTSIKTTSFEVTWTQAVGRVDGYNIVVDPAESKKQQDSAKDASSDSILLEGLTPGEEYIVDVTTFYERRGSKALVIRQRTRPLSVAPPQVYAVADKATVDITIHPTREKSVFDGYNLTLESINPPELLSYRIDAGGDTWVEDTLYGVSPGRTYTLTVYTTSGNVLSHPARMDTTITAKLAPPSKFRLMTRNTTSISLAWDPAPGDFDHYLITCAGGAEEVKCPSEVIQVSFDEGNSLTINGLIPGELYSFDIEARQEGRSSPKESLSLRPLPIPPGDIQVISRDETSIGFSWVPNTPIYSGYRVSYEPRLNVIFAGEPPAHNSTFFVREELKYDLVREVAILTGLVSGTVYDITIESSVMGEVQSEAIRIENATKPRVVKTVDVEEFGETWVHIRFSPNDGGSVEYQVRFPFENGVKTETIPSSDKDKLEGVAFNITGLEPSSGNYISVTTNSMFDVSFSKVIFVQTRPLRPVRVVIKDISETSFDLSWTSPASDVDYYEIRLYASFTKDEDVLQYTRTTSATSVNMARLTPGGKYEVVVESVYNDTHSFPVSLNVTAYPNSPTNLTSKEVTANAISLRWNNPEEDVGGIIVEWMPKHGKVELINESAMLTHLTPGIGYDIKIYTLSADKTLKCRQPANIQVLTMESPPGAPADFALQTHDITSIDASWNPPKDPNGRVISYLLHYQQLYPHPQVEVQIISIDSIDRVYKIKNLEPGAGYYVMIAAKNSAGVGTFTTRQLFGPLEDIPGRVHELTAAASSSSSIIVDWKPPKFPNGVIAGYGLTVADEEGNFVDGFDFYKKENANPYSCLLDDASSNVISALLYLHVSPADNALSNKESNKSPVDETVNLDQSEIIVSSNNSSEDISDADNSQLTVGKENTTWNDAIEERKRRSVPNEVYTHNGEFEPFCPVSFKVLGLQPYTYYSISVSAWTSVGEGEMSYTSVVTMQEPPGDAPRALRVPEANARDFTIAWSPPLESNGRLTYTFKLFAQDKDLDRVLTTNATRLLVPDLQPYNAYAVAVRASSDVGPGPWSSFFIAQTGQDAPEAVENLTAEVTSSRAVKLTWLPPSRPHGVLAEYHIEVFDVSRNLPSRQFNLPAAQYDHHGESFSRVLEVEGEAGESDDEFPILPDAERESQLGSLLQNYQQRQVTDEIMNLLPYTIYNISVSASTAKGPGMSIRRTTMALTDQDVPGSPPVNLKYTNISSSSVNISWDEPEMPNGIVTRYTIGISRGVMFKKETKGKNIVVDDLEKYSPYEVYVWPWTVVGEGRSSEKMLIHTDEDKPDSPPLDVEYRNITSSVINVSWVPPKIPNGVILRYNVYYSNDTVSNSQTSNETSVVIQRLRPYGLYTIQVTASTRIGESNHKSAPLIARTMEGQPATPPYDLRHEDMTPRSIKLWWKKPVSPNGIIQYYNVKVVEVVLGQETDGSNARNLQTPDQEPTLIIPSLKPYSTYKVWVLAHTKYGHGEQESKALTFQTMEDIPETSPRNLKYRNITSTSIRVMWVPPDVPNGRVTYYTIKYTLREGTNQTEQVDRTRGDVTEIVVRDLEMYSPYTFSVSAETKAGEGPEAVLNVLTNEDEPSTPPYDVIYEQLSSTDILLSWKPPVTPNGVILSYLIFYSNITQFLNATSYEPNITLVNLKKFGEYDVYITARTRLGDGRQRSSKTTFKTLEDAPSDPPELLSVAALSSTSVRARWLPPMTPNGRIQFYTIYYKSQDGVTHSKQITNQTYGDVNDLAKYSFYDVWVTANTALGDGGHRSDALNVRTLEDIPGPPVIVKCKSVDDQGLEATWQRPVDGNGVLVQYSLRVFDFRKDLVGEKRITESGEEHYSHIVSGLKPYSLYSVEIAVATKIGFGPYTNCTIRTDEAVPGPSYNVSVDDFGATSVDLSWKAPQEPNGVILGYEIHYETSDGVTSKEKVQSQQSLGLIRYKLTNLRKYTRYFVKVAAFNSKGASYSNTIDQTTLQGIPDHPVVTLSAYPFNSTSVMVTWSVARPITGPTYFLVRIEVASSDIRLPDDVLETETFDEKMVISNLVPFTKYHVTIIPRVTGVVGNGPQSSVDVTTFQDRPFSPVRRLRTSDVASTSVHISWERPEKANGIIVGYSLASEIISKKVPGNTTTAVLTNLDEFTEYTVSVVSETVNGSGPAAEVTFTTLQDVPGPPQDIEVREVNATSAVFSWKEPSEPNGVITKYTIYYGTPGNVKSIVLLTPRTSHAVTDLIPFTDYRVFVHASTLKGMGPASDKVMFETKEGAPSVPTNVECSAVDDFTVLVTWSSPQNSNGVLGKYLIQYKTLDKPGTTPHELAPDTTLYSLQDLTPYTLYHIEVQAVTAGGIGRSASCDVTTLQGYPLSPQGFMVKSVSDRMISLEWKEPAVTNGIIQSYSLQYQPPSSCEENNGTLQNSKTECLVDVATSKSAEFSRLAKFTEYSISVRASTARGFGPSSSLERRTAVGEPDEPPSNVRVMTLSSTLINVTWSKPAVLSGITTYRVTAVNVITNEMHESAVLETHVRDHVILGLDEDASYNVTVTAITSAGELSSKAVLATTHEDVPSDFPQDIEVVTVAGNSSAVQILFEAPNDPNGLLIFYEIEHKLKDSDVVSKTSITVSDLDDPETSLEKFSWNIVDLLGGRSYFFRMRAYTKVGPGPWSVWSDPVELPITAAPVPPARPLPMTMEDEESGKAKPKATATSITVTSPCVFSDVNGPLTSLSVIVAQDGADLDQDASDWYNSHPQNPSSPYKVLVTTDPVSYCMDVLIAAENKANKRRKRATSPTEKGFVIGADNACDNGYRKPFCNGPLKPDSAYRVKYRAETANGAITDSLYSELLSTEQTFLQAHLTMLIAVAAAVFAFFVILIISIVVIRRKKSNSSQRSPESDFVPVSVPNSPQKGTVEEKLSVEKAPIMETSVHTNSAFVLESGDDDKVREVPMARSVPKLGFGQHIARLCLNKQKGFSDEFDDIRGLPIAGTTMAAEKSCNRTKNRHARLVPYDHSRVKLEGVPSIEGSDYINASIIPVNHSVNQFIASQAPLDHTKKDFWKMLWETGASSFITLFNSADEGKKRCSEFWPRKQPEYFGSLAVQINQEDTQPEWTIRKFTVNSRDEVRQVTQFHLTSWPSIESPGGVQTILRFVQTVRANRTRESAPVIVICSSGSGRTGVFIALDRLLEGLPMQSYVDVFGTVATLRRYRPYMIQTVDEYVLVHRCVYEAINDKGCRRRSPTGDGMEETVF